MSYTRTKIKQEELADIYLPLVAVDVACPADSKNKSFATQTPSHAAMSHAWTNKYFAQIAHMHAE